MKSESVVTKKCSITKRLCLSHGTVPTVCLIPTSKVDLGIPKLLSIFERSGQIKIVRKCTDVDYFFDTGIVPGAPQSSYGSQQTSFSAAAEP